MPKTKKIMKEHQKLIFSDDVLISKEKAKEILDMLYDMGLDARDLSSVLYRVRDYIVNNMLAQIIEDMPKEDIQDLLQQISVEILNPEQAPGYECDKKSYNSNADVAWFFSQFAEAKTYEAGDIVEVQIMRVGKRNHPNYGEIIVTNDTINDVKSNFDSNKRGIDLAVDENHEDNHKALGWFKELFIDGDGLYARIELTKAGADLLTQGAYKYFSPEIIMKKVDEETGEVITNLLVGGAFTNRPFFKMMDPIKANESSGVSNHQQKKVDDAEQYLYLYNANENMNKFLKLAKQFNSKESVTQDELNELKAAFSELTAKEQANPKIKYVLDIAVEKFSEAEEPKTEDEPVTPEEPATTGEGEEPVETPSPDQPKTEDEPVTPEEPVQANEPKDTVVIKASEYESLKAKQTEHAKLLHEAKVRATQDKVNAFAFNDTTKKGLIVPAHQNNVVEFAAGLSDDQQKKFFEILGNIQSTKFSALGVEIGGGSGEAVAKDKDELVTELAAKYNEQGMGKMAAFKKAHKEVYKSLDEEDSEEVK